MQRAYAFTVMAADLASNRGLSGYRAAIAEYVQRFSEWSRSATELQSEAKYYASHALLLQGRFKESIAALRDSAEYYRHVGREDDIVPMYSELSLLISEAGEQQDALALYALHGPRSRRRAPRDPISRAWTPGQRVADCSCEASVGGTSMSPTSTSS